MRAWREVYPTGIVMRMGVGCVVVLGALGSPIAAAETAPDNGGPAVFVGGGLGLSLGDLPGPLLEGHAGGGWRASRWTAAALVSYAYAAGKPILAYWWIARHDVELVGVFAFRPICRTSFNVHGQLGIGAAFDRLSGVQPDASATALSASGGVGVGWGPAALTFRYVLPDVEVCTTSRCFHGPSSAQLLLSLTFDLYSVIR